MRTKNYKTVVIVIGLVGLLLTTDVLAARGVFDEADALLSAEDFLGAVKKYKSAAQALP